MAIQFVSYDDANMQPGKFYTPKVNLDQATALVESKVGSVELLRISTTFENERYIEALLPLNSTIVSCQIFETIRTDGINVERTVPTQATIRTDQDGKLVFIQTNTAISGRFEILYV